MVLTVIQSTRLVTHIRQAMARHCDANTPLSGGIEIDESYFGPRRVRGIC